MAFEKEMNVWELTPLPRSARIVGVSVLTRRIVARVLPDAFSIGMMKSSWPMPLMMTTSRSASRLMSCGRG